MSTQVTGAHTSTVMIRKSRLKKELFCFSESTFISEDTDLWLRLALNSKIIFINEIFALAGSV